MDWPLTGAQRIAMGGKDGANTYFASTTAHVTNSDTKGDWVQLISSTGFLAHGIIVRLQYCNYGQEYLVDIAIGAAGSEQVIINNLSLSNPTTYSHGIGVDYYFPLTIPAGVRLSARCQCTLNNKLCGVGVYLIGGGFTLPSGMDKVTTYGADTLTTRGVNVDPGASADTKGAWSEITSGLTFASKGLVMSFGTGENYARLWGGWFVDVAIGAAGSEQIIIPDYHLWCNNTHSGIYPKATPFLPLQIPAGTRIAARAQSAITNAADRLIEAFLYVVS